MFRMRRDPTSGCCALLVGGQREALYTSRRTKQKPYVTGEISGFKENTEHCEGDKRWHLEAIPTWLLCPCSVLS